MECSTALDEMFAGASSLAKELHHDKVERRVSGPTFTTKLCVDWENLHAL